MNIIIVGCGKVGATLACQLAEEGHDVTAIDINPKALKRLTEDADVMGVEGNGAVHLVQKEAGIDYADMFIAMTNSDELNLLCCLIAKRSTSCVTVARVRNPDYIPESNFIREKLGISMIINPELVSASEIARLFYIPAAIEVDTFERGRIELLSARLPENSPLVGVPIKNALGKLSGKILICAVHRNGTVFIPSGEDVLQKGETISFITTHKDATTFFKKSGFGNSSVRSVMIVGGGKISVYLTRKLCEYGFRVKIIEKDPARCEYLNSVLPGSVIIINGDGSDQRLLLEEGVDRVDGFASITDVDEENIMISLFVSSNFKKAKVVTKIAKFGFGKVLDGLSIGSPVYPKNITAELVLSYVRALSNTKGSAVQTLYNILDGRAQALEFKVKNESAVTGKTLQDLNIKKDVLLCCISRKGKMIIPGGQNTIEVGDTVVIVTTEKNINDLTEILK